jgi:nitrite reductase (NADH) small subunit
MSSAVENAAWVQVGAVDEIPRLGARVVRREGGDIAVFRNADDEVFALLNRCPHKGGPLSEGIVYGRTVACPLHNWCLDLHTGQARAPDQGCAARFPVRVEDGRVWLSPTSEAGPEQGFSHGG